MNAYPVYINVNLFIIKSGIFFYGIYQSKYPYKGIVIKSTVCLKQGTISCFYIHIFRFVSELNLLHIITKPKALLQKCNENTEVF